MTFLGMWFNIGIDVNKLLLYINFATALVWGLVIWKNEAVKPVTNRQADVQTQERMTVTRTAAGCAVDFLTGSQK